MDSDNVFIGAASHSTYPGQIGNYFDGQIDEVYIFNRTLTPTEINDTKNNNAPTDYVAYWNFDEMNGTAAADLSANANDGTLENGAYWTTVNLRSATEPNPTNTPRANFTMFSDYTLRYANIWTFNNSDYENLAVAYMSQNYTDSCMNFDFASPEITNEAINGFALSGSPIIDGGQIYTFTWTVTDETALFDTSVQWNCSDGSYDGSRYNLIDGATASGSYSNSTLAYPNLDNLCTVEFCANDTHNEITSLTAKNKYDNLDMYVGNSKVSKDKPELKDKAAKTMRFQEGNKRFFEMSFVDRLASGVKTDVERKANYKITHKVLTDNNGQVRMSVTGHYIKARRTFIDDGFYYDPTDPSNPLTTYEVKEGKTTYVIWSNPKWKANQWVVIDPSVGAINQNCQSYTFTIERAGFEGIDIWIDTWVGSMVDVFMDFGQYLWGGDGING